MRLGAVVVTALLLCGCEQAGKSGVAVIDVDVVARSLGRDVQMEQQIQARDRELNAQLQQMGNELRRVLQEEQEKVGKQPTEDQVRDLQGKAQEAGRRFQESQGAAQNQIIEYRNSIVNQFRDEVKPVAKEVAAGHGAKVVLTSAATILWFDSTIDVTSQVIERMRAKGNEVKPASNAPASTASGQSDPAAQPEASAPSSEGSAAETAGSQGSP